MEYSEENLDRLARMIDEGSYIQLVRYKRDGKYRIILQFRRRDKDDLVWAKAVFGGNFSEQDKVSADGSRYKLYWLSWVNGNAFKILFACEMRLTKKRQHVSVIKRFRVSIEDLKERKDLRGRPLPDEIVEYRAGLIRELSALNKLSNNNPE